MSSTLHPTPGAVLVGSPLSDNQFFPNDPSGKTATFVVEHNCPNCGANGRLGSALGSGDGPKVYVLPRKADGTSADRVPYAAIDSYVNGMRESDNVGHIEIGQQAARVARVRQIDRAMLVPTLSLTLEEERMSPVQEQHALRNWLRTFDVEQAQIIAWTLGSPGHPPPENPQALHGVLETLLTKNALRHNPSHCIPESLRVLPPAVRDVQMVQQLGHDAAAEKSNALLGGKSGARQLARELGIPVVAGKEDLYSVDEVGDPNAKRTIAGYVAAQVAASEGGQNFAPREQKFVIKLNNGKGGDGNAVMVVPVCTRGGSLLAMDRVREALTSIETFGAGQKKSSEEFLAIVPSVGAAVERWLDNGRSVSGKVNIVASNTGVPVASFLGSHDQLMRLSDALTHGGSVYPAISTENAPVHALVQAYTTKIGNALAERGVLSEFGVDFLYHEGTMYLLEINLRRTGTTEQDVLMASMGGQFDKDGHYRVLVPAHGSHGMRRETRVGLDVLVSQHEAFKALSPAAILKALREATLLYNPATKLGVNVSFGNLPEGRIPMRMVAPSMLEAEAMYKQAVQVLADAAGVAAGDAARAGIVQVQMPSDVFSA